MLSSLAKEFDGSVRTVKGDDLLKKDDSYPMVTTAVVIMVG